MVAGITLSQFWRKAFLYWSHFSSSKHKRGFEFEGKVKSGPEKMDLLPIWHSKVAVWSCVGRIMQSIMNVRKRRYYKKGEWMLLRFVAMAGASIASWSMYLRTVLKRFQGFLSASMLRCFDWSWYRLQFFPSSTITTSEGFCTERRRVDSWNVIRFGVVVSPLFLDMFEFFSNTYPNTVILCSLLRFVS